jgi:hypothetical protein
MRGNQCWGIFAGFCHLRKRGGENVDRENAPSVHPITFMTAAIHREQSGNQGCIKLVRRCNGSGAGIRFCGTLVSLSY